ncbi:MAG: TetR/AcrR family transcriptional regulator [Acidobacteria bacterium]|nr:TetR/AcrR family transcriptional regulator [Acidobacteriota bacterium]
MPTNTRRVAGTVRHQQILQVAKELFAKQGFEGTTTREIAERVGINEAILFRHFPHKEDLYWSVIESECRHGAETNILKGKLPDPPDDRQVFQAIAEKILSHAEEDPRLMRLLLFSALENHRLAHRFFQSYIAGRYEMLAGYIRRRVQDGAFRAVDPHLAARSFVGMVVYYALVQELFGGKLWRRFDTKHVSQTLTEIWLEGMKTQDKRPSGSRNHR